MTSWLTSRMCDKKSIDWLKQVLLMTAKALLISLGNTVEVCSFKPTHSENYHYPSLCEAHHVWNRCFWASKWITDCQFKKVIIEGNHCTACVEDGEVSQILHLGHCLTMCMEKPDSIASKFLITMIAGGHRVLKIEAIKAGLSNTNRGFWRNKGQADSDYVAYIREKPDMSQFHFPGMSYHVTMQVSIMLCWLFAGQMVELKIISSTEVYEDHMEIIRTLWNLTERQCGNAVISVSNYDNCQFGHSR